MMRAKVNAVLVYSVALASLLACEGPDWRESGCVLAASPATLQSECEGREEGTVCACSAVWSCGGSLGAPSYHRDGSWRSYPTLQSASADACTTAKEGE